MAALGTVSAKAVTGWPKAYRAGSEGSVAAFHLAALPGPPPARPELPDIAVEIHHNLGPLMPEWRQFESYALSTLYQSALWCQAWAETAGAAAGVKPVVAVGREAGRIRFILPLQLRQRGLARVLEWLGAPMHGYGLPVIDPEFMPCARQWFDGNLARIIALAGPADAVYLSENPHQIFGNAHPLSNHFNIGSASPSFAMALRPSFESLYHSKRSSERRRGSRKNESGLQQMGELRFGLPEGRQARHAAAGVMFRQQEERLAEKGIHHVFGPAERDFFHRLIDLDDDRQPVLAPFQLTLDGEVLAVMLGGIHQGAYWALISSLASGAVRKHSPGEIALRRTIEACCKLGLARFDFSAGDADYKRHWADETIEISAVLKACTNIGLIWAAVQALKLAGKRAVKRTPRLHRFALWARQALHGRKVRP